MIKFRNTIINKCGTYEKDELNRVIKIINLNTEISIQYKEDGGRIERYTCRKSGEEYALYEYDNRGHLIHRKNSNLNDEVWYEYNEDGYMIRRRTAAGSDEIRRPVGKDGKFKVVYYKSSNNKEIWFEYDEEGREIRRTTIYRN